MKRFLYLVLVAALYWMIGIVLSFIANYLYRQLVFQRWVDELEAMQSERIKAVETMIRGK